LKPLTHNPLLACLLVSFLAFSATRSFSHYQRRPGRIHFGRLAYGEALQLLSIRSTRWNLDTMGTCMSRLILYYIKTMQERVEMIFCVQQRRVRCLILIRAAQQQHLHIKSTQPYCTKRLVYIIVFFCSSSALWSVVSRVIFISTINLSSFAKK
jgi:hypothetical protein